MSIEIAGKRYPFDQMAIVGARAEVARHPAGTETVECPCSHCGELMLVDLKNRELADRTHRPFVCVLCALELWPDMLCGTHALEGRAVTLREAVERRWVGKGQAGPRDQVAGEVPAGS